MQQIAPEKVGESVDRGGRGGTIGWLVFAMGVPILLATFLPAPSGLLDDPAAHMFLEGASIVAATVVFTLAWHIAVPAGVPGIAGLAAGMLAVALLDSAHTLSYPGMPDFLTPNNEAKALVLAFAGRFTAGSALLYFLLVPKRPGGTRLALAMALGWVGLVVGGVLALGPALPDPSRILVGPVTALMWMELGLIGMYGTALWYAGRVPAGGGILRPQVVAQMAAALLVSEAAMAYSGIRNDSVAVVGHVEKLVAYLILYRALVSTAVREPTLRLTRSVAELAASEARFRELAETVSDVFFVRDLQTGGFLYVSPAFEGLWMRPVSDVMAHPTAFLEGIHPDDRGALLALRARQPEGEVDLQYRIIRPDGTMRWVHGRTRPVRDADGGVRRVAGVMRDVTEQRRMLEQLTTAQRMESVSRLAAGIAHDFNNLLTVIVHSTAFLAESAAAKDPTTEEDIGAISGAARRAQALTQQLLTLGRREAGPAASTDAAAVAEALRELLRRLVGARIRVILDTAPGVPRVAIDAGRFEQLVVNFVVNARDAMPDGGEVRVTLRAATGEDAGRHGWLHRGGRFVLLSVVDTGAGMTEEARLRAFEPFFTTKPAGSGTGLGLATCFGIVQDVAGNILLDSAPGHGTRVEVLLPVAEEAPRGANDPRIGQPERAAADR